MSDTILNIIGVQKRFNKGKSNELTVLVGANIEIARGEIVGLVGPSGAGKSTLLHIAGLLDDADEGRVELAGQDMSNASDRRRTKMRRQEIGFVYQFHHLLPEFTAKENLIIPQMANGLNMLTADRRAEELLDWVGLTERGAHRPAELSGGEQQRVAFCRAMCNAPSLLLADEPTGNLDPATSDRVFDTLIELVRDTGLSALVATHNMDLAHRMDRRVTLRGGQIVPF
ncbi:MAG: ABC transporter ATP-binding protein [Pseudomonadota bacterium]